MLSNEYIALIAAVITECLFVRKSIKVCVFFVCSQEEKKRGSFWKAEKSSEMYGGQKVNSGVYLQHFNAQTYPRKQVFFR